MTGENSLGLFTFAVPATTQGITSAGLSTGDVYFFDGTTGYGGAFQGFIIGVANPNESSFSGTLNMTAATYDVTTILGVRQVTSEISGLGSGKVDAKFGAAGSSASAAVLTGTATATLRYLLVEPPLTEALFYPFPPITLTVDGFQQSGTEQGTVNHSSFTISNGAQG